MARKIKPNKPEPATVPVYVAMAPEFVARLDARASRERRSRSTEAALILEAALPPEPAQSTSTGAA